MSHPSAILRGKILALPITGSFDDEALAEAVMASLREANPSALALVTISEQPPRS